MAAYNLYGTVILKTLVIAGSGRSGTTWVLDALAEAADLKTVFEPLHADVGKCSRKYANRYLHADQEDKELMGFMKTVLSGGQRSIWTDYRVLADRLKPSLINLYSPRQLVALYRMYKKLRRNYLRYRKTRYEGVAVKFIRANLLLEWVQAHFDVDVLCIVRHPCAVIESKMRLDAAAKEAGLRKGASDWDPVILMRRYLEDEGLREKFIAPYLGEIHVEDYSITELHAIIWSIENRQWLSSDRPAGFTVASYEKLVASDKNEWRRIIEGMGMNDSVLGRLQLGKPSEQASLDYCNYQSNASRSGRWMTRMDNSAKEAISRILEAFKISAYTVDNPSPGVGL